MTTGPFEEVRSGIDPPAGLPPTPTAAALRDVDAAVRAILCVAWLALASRADPPIPAAALAMCGALSLLGVAPVAVTAGGSLLAGLLAPAVWGVGATVAVVAIGALRLRVHAGGAGTWLRDVRKLELRRAAAAVATGLAVARSAADAGDLYERAGRARRALANLGAAPSPWIEPLRGAAERVGRALADWPSLRNRIERAATRWSE